MLETINPATGEATTTDLTVTDDATLDALASAATEAAPKLVSLGRAWRADLLDSLAAALEEQRAILVDTAAEETGLTEARLNGELSRSVFQLRLFAEAVREGGYLEAMIDHAGDTPLGPGPDLRRMLVPLGPVAVFGSSNFPFAFSVPGGDTASALAAGNPVIVKAHSAHLLTSQRAFAALQSGAERVEAPRGTLGIVYGQAAGAQLVAHPAVQAVGFTGSQVAAKRLQQIINEREVPIPLYGELQSVNPVIITTGALDERGEELATGLAGSVTGSGGQLCTKPGIVFVPTGAVGDAFSTRLSEIVAMQDPHVLLGARVHENFERVRDELIAAPGVVQLAAGASTDNGYASAASVLSVDIGTFSAEHTEEAFGPLVLLVRYEREAQLAEALHSVLGSLTATIHCGAGEPESLESLTALVAPRAGRILYAGFPTGVRVSWAQHHGGPWPATNSLHTSVGVTAMRRFLRPMVWQDAPESVLPAELRETDRSVPRRVDGVLELAG
ncbi:MAG TPA: aldehyde dehydrogenase (NADP(+)) [Candidatus Agrococcus pullicola]|uniref:Aldehyde dehydrogenase (NADP(+)) n=1 Tax=Candidatus Agrococcus pullicola TaxID=2838429 RepID=A0A9D1YWU7_9MICO|nr:aldehyde dehydrogenase (NADP(+)) [Candidatus Agrococcus pullicola]